MSVFISYRRDGGDAVAKEIYNYLNSDYEVFRDQECLKNGRFDLALKDALMDCSDFILIVTPTVFDRCSQPNDWIMQEVQIAISGGKNIIPIFVGTSTFPSNIPSELLEIAKFNAIFWNETNQACEKLKTFLKSNKRIVLDVVKNGNHFSLSEECLEKLIELYKRFDKNGRAKTKFELQIHDVVELSKEWIRNDLVAEYGTSFAEQEAQQRILRRIERYKKIIELAIENLVLYSSIDTCANQLCENYAQKYGISRCFFVNESDVEKNLCTPMLWADIIEEMLKELVFSRINQYANSSNYIGLDCLIKDSVGIEFWHFVSYVPNLDDNVCQNFLRKIAFTYMGKTFYRPTYIFDVPITYLAYFLYPDWFLNLAELQIEEPQTYEKLATNKRLLSLSNYLVGMH